MKLMPWTSNSIFAGQKYARLTVISTHVIAGTYRYIAKCKCDCGKEPLYIRVDKLRGKKGLTRSCGCFNRDRATKHGAWRNPLFKVWSGIMRRCYNPKDKRYIRYGGRGISVCQEWHDVNKFIDDMTEGYKRGLQIDRVDNDQGYSKENCRWATIITQAQNRSDVVRITFHGKTLCISQWSRELGIPYSRLLQRLRSGWSVEESLTTAAIPHGYTRKTHDNQ